MTKKEKITVKKINFQIAQIYSSKFNNENFFTSPNNIEKYSLFRPNRKLISYYQRDKAIQVAAETIVAGQIMHNDRLIYNDWNELVKKEKVILKKIYDKLRIKKFRIHPELINMYKYNRI